LSSINGDSTDNIPGCFRAGAAAATLEVNIIAKEEDKVAAILRIKAFYISWHTVVYKRNKL
jgi:hypothetical protein